MSNVIYAETIALLLKELEEAVTILDRTQAEIPSSFYDLGRAAGKIQGVRDYLLKRSLADVEVEATSDIEPSVRVSGGAHTG